MTILIEKVKEKNGRELPDEHESPEGTKLLYPKMLFKYLIFMVLAYLLDGPIVSLLSVLAKKTPTSSILLKQNGGWMMNLPNYAH